MNFKYVAIIDAGSTSSRLLIYSYQWEEEHRYNKPLKFKKIFEKDNGAPIHKAETETAMTDQLRQILQKGAEVLIQERKIVTPENHLREVPLYVMATAGMRDVSGQPVEGGQDTMNRAWDAIHELRRDDESLRIYNHGADHEDDIPDDDIDNIKSKHSFVVSGEQEGVYAWVALNHGRYQPDQVPGVLELGGKSMQIAYRDPTNRGGEPVCLDRSRNLLRTSSWVLGAEESRYFAVEKKLLDIRAKYNPCLPHHQPVTISDRESPQTERRVIGSGDFSKCLAFAHSYLDDVVTNAHPLPPLDIEPFTKRFYGTSSFWHTYKFFSQGGFYDKNSPYDPILFRKAVDQYCNGSWLRPFTWNEDGVRHDQHIHKHCFAAAWTMALFHGRKGFHLQLSDQKAWKGLIRFPSTADLGDRSSWTIGVATMVARNGDPKKYCNDNERHGPYPPQPGGGNLVEHLYNATTSPIRGTSVVSNTGVVAPPTSSFITESTEPISGLLPNLQLNKGFTSSEALACGILLIVVLVGYWLFSTRRVTVQVPVSDEKRVVGVAEQPIMVRARRAFFDQTRGTIFLAGEEKILCV